MGKSDRNRWDQKWADMLEPGWPSLLLSRYYALLDGGLALDVACGLGQNTIWLANHGYKALGVDISAVALRRAWKAAVRQSTERSLLFMQVDLDKWRPPPAAFDLICVFRFLARPLFPALSRALRPEGLLFYETRHVGIKRRIPGANPVYLLQRGELEKAFSQLNIVLYEEDAENARLVARK